MAEYTKILRTPQDVSDYLNYGAGSVGSPQWADSNNTVKIYIGNDIDMSQSEKFNIIPDAITSIEGLNGNKYTISYLNMERIGDVYFAKTNNAKNIAFKDINLNGTNCISPLTDATGGSSICTYENISVTGKIQGAHTAGIVYKRIGIEGNLRTTIKKSNFSGTLLATNICGGIICASGYTQITKIEDCFTSAIANNYFSAPTIYLIGSGYDSQTSTLINNSFFIGNVGKNASINFCALCEYLNNYSIRTSNEIYAYILNPNILNGLYGNTTYSMITGKSPFLPSLNFVSSVGDVPVGRRGQQDWNDFMIAEENINMAYLSDLGWPI